tara:strand:+ start:169 stop:1689 length:1521 start_codon:yes stop_codon:yes gene_type:complete
MPSKATKRLNKKEIDKITEDAEKKIEENIDTIDRISPFYDFVKGNEQPLAAYNRFSNDYSIRNQIPSNPNGCDFNRFHTIMCENFYDLFRHDIKSQLGLDANKSKENLYGRVKSNIRLFNGQNRYYMLRKIYELDFISKLTKAIVMLGAYYSNDDTECEWSYKIGKLCFGSNVFDYATIKDKLEFEMKILENQQGDDIEKHFCYSEINELKKLLDIGEPFSVYRGVLIEPNEMIRGEGKRKSKKEIGEEYKGRKEDGEDLYRKWNAGRGVSLTLTKETAYFFCDWNLKNKSGIDIDSYEPNNERYRELDRIPLPLKTKEERIEQMTILTSSLMKITALIPVVVELEINPKDIVGEYFNKSEAEVNVLPENCKVKHYELVSAKDIQNKIYDTYHRRAENVENYHLPLDRDGVALLIVGGKPIFADGSKVCEEIEIIKDKLKSGEETMRSIRDEMVSVYKKYEVKLPKNVKYKIGSPISKTYFEWLKNPVKKLIEARRSKTRSKGKGF